MSKKPTLDQSPAARQRRQALVEERLAADPATGSARAAARRQIETEVQQEEIATAQAAAAQAEARQERERIRGVVAAGRDRDRGRQALRAALLAPISPEAAMGLLATVARDDAAEPAALAVPGFASFGGPAAEAERRRIAGAFARPEAEGRFAAVAALILDGDGALTGEQIAPLLMTLPPEAAKTRTPSPGERAKGMVWFGNDHSPIETKSERIDALWARAAQAANAAIGTGAIAPSTSGGAVDPLAGLPGVDDPGFGTKAEHEQIMAAHRNAAQGRG